MESQTNPPNLLSAEAEFSSQGKQRLLVRHPLPLATSEASNQSWSVDFIHDALICGHRFARSMLLMTLIEKHCRSK